MKTLKNVLKICFSLSLFLMIGCSTLNKPQKQDVWLVPVLPQMKHVEILPFTEKVDINNGMYISKEYAANLVYNIDEQRAYIEKLDLLVRTMAKYYGCGLKQEK